MPDLGNYAFEVLMSYGIGIVLIAGLTGLSVVQARRAKRALEAVERDG